jgi:hypothetical protein
MQIKSIGIDLGKTTFHLIALGSHSQVVIRKKFSRSQRLVYTANLPPSLIGMEAAVRAAAVFTPPTRCSMLCHVPASHATYTVQSAGNCAAFRSAIIGASAGHRSGFVFNPVTVAV